MNIKDYKAIAEIINYQIFLLKDCVSQPSRGITKEHLTNVTNRLADYFEKEEQIARHPECECTYEEFNKEQFLKDCGVD